MSVKGLDNLRTLFAQEAEERLARLGQLVLDLEQCDLADSADVIAEVFREVHTLKGSAAVVGFEDVGRYAHGVEDKLGQLRSGSVAPTTAITNSASSSRSLLPSCAVCSSRQRDSDSRCPCIVLR